MSRILWKRELTGRSIESVVRRGLAMVNGRLRATQRVTRSEPPPPESTQDAPAHDTYWGSQRTLMGYTNAKGQGKAAHTRLHTECTSKKIPHSRWSSTALSSLNHASGVGTHSGNSCVEWGQISGGLLQHYETQHAAFLSSCDVTPLCDVTTIRAPSLPSRWTPLPREASGWWRQREWRHSRASWGPSLRRGTWGSRVPGSARASLQRQDRALVTGAKQWWRGVLWTVSGPTWNCQRINTLSVALMIGCSSSPPSRTIGCPPSTHANLKHTSHPHAYFTHTHTQRSADDLLECHFHAVSGDLKEIQNDPRLLVRSVRQFHHAGLLNQTLFLRSLEHWRDRTRWLIKQRDQQRAHTSQSTTTCSARHVTAINAKKGSTLNVDWRSRTSLPHRDSKSFQTPHHHPKIFKLPRPSPKRLRTYNASSARQHRNQRWRRRHETQLRFEIQFSLLFITAHDAVGLEEWRVQCWSQVPLDASRVAVLLNAVGGAARQA